LCGGVPYHHAQKVKKDFPWLILVPGALHEEMNMVKAFVELNWAVDIKNFAQCQWYQTESSFDSSKNVLIIINPGIQYVIYTHSMSSELIWPYVISEENPSAEGISYPIL